eukprot:1706174-Rhodomonas_salina.1
MKTRIVNPKRLVGTPRRVLVVQYPGTGSALSGVQLSNPAVPSTLYLPPMVGNVYQDGMCLKYCGTHFKSKSRIEKIHDWTGNTRVCIPSPGSWRVYSNTQWVPSEIEKRLSRNVPTVTRPRPQASRNSYDPADSDTQLKEPTLPHKIGAHRKPSSRFSFTLTACQIGSKLYLAVACYVLASPIASIFYAYSVADRN